MMTMVMMIGDGAGGGNGGGNDADTLVPFGVPSEAHFPASDYFPLL